MPALLISVSGTPVSAHLHSIQISNEINGRNSTAEFVLHVAPGDTGLPVQHAEVEIVNDDTDAKIFAGFVVNISRTQLSSDLQAWRIGCIGLESLLTKVIVNESWTSKTDRQIIQDAFGDYLPEITTDNSTVTELAIALDYEAKDETLKELLEHLSQLAGAEFLITPDKELVWRDEGSASAPFGFSDSPNNSSTFAWRIRSDEEDATEFANKVTILGAFNGTDGAELRATAEDSASQTALGRTIEAVVVAREIDNQAALDLAADIELERRAVRRSISFDFDQPGIEPGMLVAITSTNAGINDSFVVQSLTLTQKAPDWTVYSAKVGSYMGRLNDRMRALERIKNGPKLQPAVPPPPDSIGSGQLKDSAVTRLKIAANAVDTARLEVAAVTESILAASAVTETKIASNAISTPKIQTGAITSGTIASGAIVAGKIATDAVTAGTIAAGAITAADAVFATGAIQTADIANAAISTAKIGDAQITGAKIASATITNANIANATIEAAKINTVSADSITTGTLNAARIATGSISGTKLEDGTVSAVKIASVSADSITTGTLNAARIATGSLDGTKLSDGTISDVKISSGLSASKITTGNMSADRLSGGSCTIATFACASASTTGNMTVGAILSVGSSATISGGLTAASIGVGGGNINAGSYQVSSSTVINGFGQFVGNGVNTSSGVGCAGVNISGGVLTVNGTQVVGSRQSDPGSPSFSNLSDAQTWCSNLRSALQAHGLI